jgi:hypothetical protein
MDWGEALVGLVRSVGRIGTGGRGSRSYWFSRSIGLGAGSLVGRYWGLGAGQYGSVRSSGLGEGRYRSVWIDWTWARSKIGKGQRARSPGLSLGLASPAPPGTGTGGLLGGNGAWVSPQGSAGQRRRPSHGQ